MVDPRSIEPLIANMQVGSAPDEPLSRRREMELVGTACAV